MAQGDVLDWAAVPVPPKDERVDDRGEAAAEQSVVEPAEAFDRHPLYLAAMEDMAAGDTGSGIAKLKLLASLFPQEPRVQEAALRAELQATLGSSRPIPVQHRQPKPVLRVAVAALALLVIAIIGIAGFTVAYHAVVVPAREQNERDVAALTLRQQGRQRLAAGDWAGARDSFQKLLELVPGDATARKGIDASLRYEDLDRRYVDAVTMQQQGELQNALALLRSLQKDEPAYPGLGQRIAAIERQLLLEAQWQAAQDAQAAQDLEATIGALVELRAQDPDYRRSQVEQQLHEAYIQMALPMIEQANGNLDRLRLAIEALDRGLALRPGRGEYSQERRLAAGYIAGAEAFDRQDWVGAVVAWEPVYAVRPDYQGTILASRLAQAYPLAARQLLAGAAGNTVLIQRAVDYMKQALQREPDNAEMLEERRLALEFLAGADAFGKEDWGLAVAHWSPIYAVRPDYQSGVLKIRWREACVKGEMSDQPDCQP